MQTAEDVFRQKLMCLKHETISKVELSGHSEKRGGLYWSQEKLRERLIKMALRYAYVPS